MTGGYRDPISDVLRNPELADLSLLAVIENRK